MPTQTDPSGVETNGMPDSPRLCQLVIVAPIVALAAMTWIMASDFPSLRQTNLNDSLPQLEAVAESASTSFVGGRSLQEWRELMNALDHGDPTRAAYVPGLIEIVQSLDVPWFTRRQAALTLGRWGEPAAAAVPVLIKLLDDPEARSEEGPTFWALKGLSLFGPVAGDAVPTVVKIVLDAMHPVSHRLAGMECLSQIGNANPAGLAPLIQIAQTPEGDQVALVLRRGAIEALSLFRGGAPAAVPALIRTLDDSDTNLRREAAAALGRQGTNAEIAQPALFERLVSDADPGVRDAAGVALAQTGPSAIPAFVSLLNQDDPDLQIRSATVLGKFGRVAGSAAPMLKEHWDSPDAAVRLAALDAYWRVAGVGEEVAVRTAEALTSNDRNIRRQAYLLLVALGPAANAAKPVLAEQLTHSRSEIRSAARKLLQTQDK